MKRMLLYIVILSLSLLAPVKASDIGKLLPVQVVSIYRMNEQIVMETDTENRGFGETAQQALQNLKDTASGMIYLDTAQYLLLSEDTKSCVEELLGELKDSVKLCQIEKRVDLTETARYLSVRDGLPTLKQWRNDRNLPVLSDFENSSTFLKKVEKRA